jgi:hypothetical protein
VRNSQWGSRPPPVRNCQRGKEAPAGAKQPAGHRRLPACDCQHGHSRHGHPRQKLTSRTTASSGTSPGAGAERFSNTQETYQQINKHDMTHMVQQTTLAATVTHYCDNGNVCRVHQEQHVQSAALTLFQWHDTATTPTPANTHGIRPPNRSLHLPPRAYTQRRRS